MRPFEAAGRTATTGAASIADPGRQRVAKLGRVLCRKIDFVLDTVQGEGNSLRRLAAVDVVNQENLHLLGHVSAP